MEPSIVNSNTSSGDNSGSSNISNSTIDSNVTSDAVSASGEMENVTEPNAVVVTEGVRTTQTENKTSSTVQQPASESTTDPVTVNASLAQPSASSHGVVDVSTIQSRLADLTTVATLVSQNPEAANPVDDKVEALPMAENETALAHVDEEVQRRLVATNETAPISNGAAEGNDSRNSTSEKLEKELTKKPIVADKSHREATPEGRGHGEEKNEAKDSPSGSPRSEDVPTTTAQGTIATMTATPNVGSVAESSTSNSTVPTGTLVQTNISEGEEVSIAVIAAPGNADAVNESLAHNDSTALLFAQGTELNAAVVDAALTNATTLPEKETVDVRMPPEAFSENNTVGESIAGKNETKPKIMFVASSPPPISKKTTTEVSRPVSSPVTPAPQTGNTTRGVPPTNETSVIVSVTYTDEQNETFMTTKDNITLPIAVVKPTRPANLNPSSSQGPSLIPSSNSSPGPSTSPSLFSSSGSRRYSPPTRRTTANPYHGEESNPSKLHGHHAKSGLKLPTRKTTLGAKGPTTRRPLGGRGTRAPFGLIGSTRRTTLGTKPTIRPLTRIFDRARTRAHTGFTSARPTRGMRMRFTTGKPVRKGFPIGPKHGSMNGTGFDLDAYTRLLNVTRRPRTKPTTWRTTFFNVTEPTLLNEVEQPVVRVAGIVKIIDGWEWSPLLGDHNTHEYRYMAYTTRRLLESVFRKTSVGNWLYRVEIDGFSPGSIIVDYFVLLYQRNQPVEPASLIRAFNSHLGVNDTLGEFTLDPTYTQFEVVGVVRPKPLASSAEPPIPQWAIAVIVIATASLIFMVLFGAVTIYGRSAERRKYSNRLQEDDLEKVGTPTKDWESKLAASYENFAADSVYDTEDSPQESAAERYKAW